jgi:hypothetical protein
MTVPQVAKALAMLLREAWGLDDPARMARSMTRQLKRNEASRLYHWRKKGLLAPSRQELRT